MARKIQAALEFFAKLCARGDLDANPFWRDGTHSRGFVLSRKAGREEHFDFAFGFPANGFDQVGVVFAARVGS